MIARKIKRTSIILLIAICCSICINIIPQSNANAYFHTNKNSTAQCFAVSYHLAKGINGPEYMSQGEKQSNDVIAYSYYSTDKICAYIDENGKVKGKLVYTEGVRPPDTENIPFFPKLKTNKDKTGATLTYCQNGDHYCLNVDGGGRKTDTFLVEDYTTFYDFAKAINDTAQNGYFGATKEALKDDKGKEIAGSLTEAKDEAIDEIEKDDTDSSAIEQTCENMGGAQSLGWIVCPIMTWLGEASSDLYNKYVEPALSVDPALFTDSNSNVLNAWSTFQNIANIIFVILLLIVIFSQLTGVGIDNYGIKKILPKLIISAILINLSFIICMVAVDLSNILGNAFQALFEGLSIDMPLADTIDVEGTPVDISSASGTIASVGVLISMVTATGAMWHNPAIVASLLVSALGVVISIVFLFVILATREAAIIVLTVISPVAVVCYMLPNTKKFFDRWLKGMEGLLLVYPICGLLVGGGNYVSKLLLTSGFSGAGFISAFTAMIAGIVPVFFIPTVLSNSFSALGNLGARISGLGQRLSGATTRGIRNTEGYRALQNRGAERRNRMLAGFDSSGNVTRAGAIRARIASSRFGRAIGYQALQGARVAAAEKAREEGIQSNAALGELGRKYDQMRNPGQDEEAILREQLVNARNRGDANEIFSVIENMKRSNMQASHIAQATRDILGNSNIGNMSAGQKENFLREFGNRYGNDFLKKDFEQAHWARSGGVSNGQAENLGVGGRWAHNNIGLDDMKDEDVASLSADRLYDMMAAGSLSQAQAQRVWASNANMDDANRLMLGAYSNSGTMLSKAQAQSELKNPSMLGAEQVAAYTERAPEDVVIRDVRWKDKQGQHQQTDTLEVHQNPTSTPPRP